jgi:hypothetical protein
LTASMRYKYEGATRGELRKWMNSFLRRKEKWNYRARIQYQQREEGGNFAATLYFYMEERKMGSWVLCLTMAWTGEPGH